MKIWQNILVLFIFLIGIASSCRDSEKTSQNDDSPRIIRNTKIISPQPGLHLIVGDAIPFEIGTRETEIDSIVLEYDGRKEVFKTNKFSWFLPKGKVGSQKIRIQAYYDGDSETHYPKVVFYSDITPEKYTYTINNTYPHSAQAFTQGLFFLNDTLVESTGQRGESYIAKVNEKTGQIYQRYDLPSDYFGEGTCLWEDKIIQLTYTSQKGFVYNTQFNLERNFNYSYEGWGITALNDTLYVTDGTHVIHLLEPRDFSEIGKIEVFNENSKIDELNELEVIDGLIYANIWREDIIVAIDPGTGRVMKEIDLSGLLTPAEQSRADVLNGIAYNPNTKKLLVTGKLWPKLFDINIIPQ